MTRWPTCAAAVNADQIRQWWDDADIVARRRVVAALFEISLNPVGKGRALGRSPLAGVTLTPRDHRREAVGMIPLLTVQCTDNEHPQPRVLARLSIGIKDGRVVMGRQGRTYRHTTDGRFVKPQSTEGAATAAKRPDGGVTFTSPAAPAAATCRCAMTDSQPSQVSAPDEIASQPADGRLAWDVSSVDIST